MKIRDILAGLPDGVYLLRLVEAELAQSQAGRPMRVLRWEVATGPYQGREIRDWLVVTGEGLRRWAQLYLALGGSEDDEVRTVDELAEKCLARLRAGTTVWGEVVVQAGPDGIARPKVRAYHGEAQGKILAQQYARRNSMVPF